MNQVNQENKSELDLKFIQLTVHNRKILELLVNNCFPITYTNEFYKSVPVLYKDYGRLIYLKEIPVAGILCRTEDEKDDKDELEDVQESIKNLKLKNMKTEEKQPKDKFLHLMIILVLKNYRRLGIAKKIMQFVYERVKEIDENIQYIKLHVLKSNESAIKFYVNEGFDIVKEIPNHYDLPDGNDSTALLMSKKIQLIQFILFFQQMHKGFLFFDALNQICQIEKNQDENNRVLQCGTTRFFYTAILQKDKCYEIKISSLNYQQENLFENFFNNNQIFSSIFQFTPVKIFVNGQIVFVLSDQGCLYVLGIDNQQTGLLGIKDSIFSVDDFTQVFLDNDIQSFATCSSFNLALDDKNQVYFWGTLQQKQKSTITYTPKMLKQDFLTFTIDEIFLSFYQDIFLLDKKQKKIYEVSIDTNMQIRIKSFRKIEESNKICIQFVNKKRILYQANINKEKIIKQIYKFKQPEIFIKSSQQIQYKFEDNYLFVFNQNTQILDVLDLNKKINQELIFSYKFKHEINLRFEKQFQFSSFNTINILPIQFITTQKIGNSDQQKFLDMDIQTVLKMKSDLLKQEKNKHKNFFEFNYSYIENNVNIKMKTDNSEQSFNGQISNKSKELKISGTLLQNFSFSRNQNNFQDKLKSLIDIFNTNQTNKMSNHQNNFNDRISKCKQMILGNTKTIKNIGYTKNDFQGFREKIKNLKIQQIQTEESLKDQSYTCSLIFDQDHSLYNKKLKPIQNASLMEKNKQIFTQYIMYIEKLLVEKSINIQKMCIKNIKSLSYQIKLQHMFLNVFNTFQYNNIKLGMYYFSQQYIGFLMINSFEKFFRKQKQDVIVDIIYTSQLYKKLYNIQQKVHKAKITNAFLLIRDKKQQKKNLDKLFNKVELCYQVKKLEIIKNLQKFTKNLKAGLKILQKLINKQKIVCLQKLKNFQNTKNLKQSKSLEKYNNYQYDQKKLQTQNIQNDINKPQVYQVESIKGSLQEFINSNSENLSKVDLSYIRESLPDTEFAKYCEYLFDYKERIKMTDSSSQFSKPSDIDIPKKSNTRDPKNQFFELVNNASLDKDFQVLNSENFYSLKNFEYQNQERENTPQVKQQWPIYNIEQSQQINNLSEIKEENSSLEKSLYSNINEKRVSEKIKHVFKKQNKTPEIDIQEKNQEEQSYNALLIKNLATLKSNIKKLNTENSKKDKYTDIKEENENSIQDSQDFKRVDIYLDTEENQNEDQKRQSANSTYQKNITFKGLRDIAKIKHYNQNTRKSQKNKKKLNSSKSKNQQKSQQKCNFQSQRSIGSFKNKFRMSSKQSLDFKRNLNKNNNFLNQTEKIYIHKNKNIIPIKDILQEQNQTTEEVYKVENYLTKEIQKKQQKTHQSNTKEQTYKPSFSVLRKQFSSDLTYSKPEGNKKSFVQQYRVNKNEYNKFKQKNHVRKPKSQQDLPYYNKRCGSVNFTNKIQRNQNNQIFQQIKLSNQSINFYRIAIHLQKLKQNYFWPSFSNLHYFKVKTENLHASFFVYLEQKSNNFV